MSYTWTDGEIITAEKLNNIENGIDNNNFLITVTPQEGSNDLFQLDKTYEEILTALTNGKICFILFSSPIPNDNHSYVLYADNCYFDGSKYTVTFANITSSFSYMIFESTSSDGVLVCNLGD